MQLHVAVGELWIAGIQPCQLIINDFALAAVHGAFKHPVHKIQYAGTGAEIAGEGQQCAAPARAVCLIFFEEKPGLSLAEAVDGLLYIAHHEQVIAAHDAGNDGFLHVGGILIFIHEYVIVAFPEGTGGILIPEGQKGAPLQVGIGQRGEFGLAFVEDELCTQGDIAQRFQHRSQGLHIPQGCAQIDAAQGDPVNCGFCVAAQFFHFVVDGNILFLTDGVLLVFAQSTVEGVIALHFLQGLQGGKITFQCGIIITVAAGMLHAHACEQDGAADFGMSGFHKGVQPTLPEPFIGMTGHVEPAFGIGPLLQRPQQQLRHAPHALGAAGIVQREQFLRGSGISLLHGRIQRLIQQAARFSVVQHAEGRVDPGRFKVAAQEVGTEAVQSSDGGTFHQQLLGAAIFIACCCALAQLLFEFGAHVGRCGAGEGDDEHAVNPCAA